MELACSRANDNQRTGIRTGSMMSTKGKRASWRTAVVIYFPKAKKGDESKYGFKSKYKDTTYGLCNFCPFCGAQLEESAVRPPERAKKAASRPSSKPHEGLVAGGEKPGAAVADG